MDKKEIKVMIGEGWIRINMIFEMIGNPKEYIENTLKDYMANIKTDSDIKVLEEDYGQAEEIDKGLFSTFVEANILVKDLNKLTWLCFNFTPASIEILEPNSYTFGARDIQNWINDILAKLHEVGAISKQIASQNKLMVNNFNRLLKNAMIFCINMGFDTPKEIEEKIGIPHDQLKPFFEALAKEGKLKVSQDQKKPKKAKPKKGKKK